MAIPTVVGLLAWGTRILRAAGRMRPFWGKSAPHLLFHSDSSDRKPATGRNRLAQDRICSCHSPSGRPTVSTSCREPADPRWHPESRSLVLDKTSSALGGEPGDGCALGFSGQAVAPVVLRGAWRQRLRTLPPSGIAATVHRGRRCLLWVTAPPGSTWPKPAHRCSSPCPGRDTPAGSRSVVALRPGPLQTRSPTLGPTADESEKQTTSVLFATQYAASGFPGD